MKFSRRDFLKLRMPLLAAIAMLAIASLLAWWSAQDSAKARHERNDILARKNQVEQRLSQVRSEEQELRERAEIFRQLQKNGISGEEKRLDWIELLRSTQQELRIPGMNYEFGAQKALESVPGAAYAYFASPLRLQLRLLHEEDLLNFLTRIQQQAKAMVLVRQCKLAPLARSAEAREFAAQLAAECEMQWVTVRRSSGTK